MSQHLRPDPDTSHNDDFARFLDEHQELYRGVHRARAVLEPAEALTLEIDEVLSTSDSSLFIG